VSFCEVSEQVGLERRGVNPESENGSLGGRRPALFSSCFVVLDHWNCIMYHY
jgi:hypothetical protein